MAKREKMYFRELPMYSKFMRGSIEENDTVYFGWFYWLEKPLTDEQKEELLKRVNVRLRKSRSEYAPEQKRDVVFLADKVMPIGMRENTIQEAKSAIAG